MYHFILEPSKTLFLFIHFNIMIRRLEIITSLLIVLITLSLFFYIKCKSASSQKPNIILIITDDQGYGDIGAHGNPYINTPHLDQLYNESIRFTDFHVGTTCAPSRAALMTGRDGNRVGVWHTIAGRSQLGNSETTMAEVLSENGYHTGMFGKWHLGDSYPFRPQDRGFDDAIYHGGGGIWQGPDYWDNDYFDDTYFDKGEPKKYNGYCTDVWFNEALKFISDNSSDPFFAYIAPNAPHFPYHVDSSFIQPYLNNENIVNPNFNGMITNIDDNMGRLMLYLKESGLAKNTILIFMTDNGSSSGSDIDVNGYVTRGYNAGMRGKKVWHYEGGHRVPLFIKWPTMGWQGGKDINSLTSHIDLLPTLVDKLNLTYSGLPVDGVSLAPLLDSETGDKRYNRILITDTQRRENPKKWYRSCTMKDKWRLIDGVELYNIYSDPGQKTDVSSENPLIVSQLRNGYELWWEDVSSFFEETSKAILSDNEETILYAHDWHEAENNLGLANVGKDGAHMVPWNQTQIRLGQEINGYWALDVKESGSYTFELRRWPREANTPINNSFSPKDAVSGGISLPEGKSLQITKASLYINDIRVSETEVSDIDKAATLTADLAQGPIKVKTTFEGENDQKLGAYYVYINKP